MKDIADETRVKYGGVGYDPSAGMEIPKTRPAVIAYGQCFEPGQRGQ